MEYKNEWAMLLTYPHSLDSHNDQWHYHDNHAHGSWLYRQICHSISYSLWNHWLLSYEKYLMKASLLCSSFLVFNCSHSAILRLNSFSLSLFLFSSVSCEIEAIKKRIRRIVFTPECSLRSLNQMRSIMMGRWRRTRTENNTWDRWFSISAPW